jgi:hypothetical protein
MWLGWKKVCYSEAAEPQAQWNINMYVEQPLGARCLQAIDSAMKDLCSVTEIFNWSMSLIDFGTTDRALSYCFVDDGGQCYTLVGLDSFC